MTTKIYDVQLENGCGDDLKVTVVHDDEQEAVRIAKEIANNPDFEHYYLNCTELFKVTSRDIEIKQGTVLAFKAFDHECGLAGGGMEVCP